MSDKQAAPDLLTLVSMPCCYLQNDRARFSRPTIAVLTVGALNDELATVSNDMHMNNCE